MAGAGSRFAIAGITSRTSSPTWGHVLTASRWIGSTTKAITNRATAVGRHGSSKCAIAAQIAASAIPMPSSQRTMWYRSTDGGSRRHLPFHCISIRSQPRKRGVHRAREGMAGTHRRWRSRAGAAGRSLRSPRVRGIGTRRRAQSLRHNKIVLQIAVKPPRLLKPNLAELYSLLLARQADRSLRDRRLRDL